MLHARNSQSVRTKLPRESAAISERSGLFGVSQPDFFFATFLLHSCVASCVLWAVQSCIFQLAVDLSVFGKKGQHLTGCCKPTEASESLEKPFSPELCPSSDSVVVIVKIILWSWDWLKSKSPKAKWEWHIESVMDLPKADRWKKKKKRKSQIWKRTEIERLIKMNRPPKRGAYHVAFIVLYPKLIWLEYWPCRTLAQCSVRLRVRHQIASSPDSFTLAAVWMLLSWPQRSVDLTQTTERSCPNENTLGIKESDTPCRVCFVSCLWPGLSAPFIRSVCTRGSFVIFAPAFADTAVGLRVGSRPALCFLSPKLESSQSATFATLLHLIPLW